MNEVTERSDGTVSCSCGATGNRDERARFRRRHPELCSARQRASDEKRAFAKQLAQGVRSVPETGTASDVAAGDIGEMLEKVGNSDVELTGWEKEFLRSIQAQWLRTQRLSSRQESVLKEIYQKCQRA